MTRPFGMHPKAFRAWIDACFAAKVSPTRITHTIDINGHRVDASAGTHDKDGEVDGEPYTAAFDIHVTDLTQDQMQSLLSECYKRFIIGWERKAPTWHGQHHGHFIYLACEMKGSLQSQVHDWFMNPPRDGLAAHNREAHAPVTQDTIEACRRAYLHYNRPS